MDAQAQKKALFRAKLNAQEKEKRIESPLVRYNEVDQPVCRVCDVVLKHESNWDARKRIDFRINDFNRIGMIISPSRRVFFKPVMKRLNDVI